MKYLEELPLSNIAKFAKGQPSDGVPFSGCPRVHPSEKNKFLLVYDPLGTEPVVLEFKLDDILFVDEVPSAITEAGEGVPMVKLWIRRGAFGVILEPFEVDDPSKIAAKARAVKERLTFSILDPTQAET